MIEAVICEPLRTPVGGYGGAFKDLPAAALAEAVLRGLVQRTGIKGEDVDDVILGQCYPNGEAPAIGRIAALDAELGIAVPGMQIDRRCGSGLQAVIDAAMRVQTGAAELVIAGGAESMSGAEHYVLGGRWALRGDQQPLWDRIARGRITSGGRFHPIAGGMLESLAKLKAIRIRQDPEATVTAGNASGQNDGAAACIVASRAKAEALGLRPLARLVSWGNAGVGPERMGIGPVPSTEKALARAGLSFKDIDLIELNEAFAAQALACTTAWKLGEDDFERLNVNGSGISLGHPVGATGVRILSTMLRELDRQQGRYALETMCIGGGQGLTAIFERIA
ncbi:thiolase family protein [Sphingobium xenophagum]